MALAFVVGCADEPASGEVGPDGSVVLVATDPVETALSSFEYRVMNQDVVASDVSYYTWLNREEIMSTVEIVDVDSLDGRVAVFMRYSVGTTVFRDGFMLRRVNDRWAITSSETYFSEYDDDWKQDSTVVFDKRLYDWVSESPDPFEGI